MAALMRHFYLEGFDVVQVSYGMLCLQVQDTFKAGSTIETERTNSSSNDNENGEGGTRSALFL
jgi:hypothetical protein